MAHLASPLIVPMYSTKDVARVGKKIADAITGEPGGLACEALTLILLTELRERAISDNVAKSSFLAIFDRVAGGQQ